MENALAVCKHSNGTTSWWRSQEEHILGLGWLAVFLLFLPELVGLTIRWKMLDLRVFDRIDRRLEEGHLEEGHESERLQYTTRNGVGMSARCWRD